jgi:hypothetical protein
MFRIFSKTVIQHGGKFAADFAQGAIEDQVKSTFKMNYVQTGKPTAGAAAASILRAHYASMMATKVAAPGELAGGATGSPGAKKMGK